MYCSDKNTWILVKWMEKSSDSTYEVVNITDIEFQNQQEFNDLEIGCLVLVKYGINKLIARVKNISEVREDLDKEVEILRRLSMKTPKEYCRKKLKIMDTFENILLVPQFVEKCTQTEVFTNNNSCPEVLSLRNEIQELKAELYESNKLVNSICSDLKSIMHRAQGIKKEIVSEHDFVSNSTSFLQNIEPKNGSTFVEIKNKVLIGNNQTAIPKRVFSQIDWTSYKHATSKLLSCVFSRDTLATHSLTGKPSPAFANCEKLPKSRLDPAKVSDIVEVVSVRCGIPEPVVRSAITTKCADENKMMKKRILRNKENIAAKNN